MTLLFRTFCLHCYCFVITLWLWINYKYSFLSFIHHSTFDRNKKFSSASKVVRLLFAQRFITTFNCHYHTSNHLSVCNKPTSLSPINCQSVDNWCEHTNSKLKMRKAKQEKNVVIQLLLHTCEPSGGSIFLPILRVPSFPPVNFQNLPPMKKIKYNKKCAHTSNIIFYLFEIVVTLSSSILTLLYCVCSSHFNFSKVTESWWYRAISA
jgi:hypothetical protein